MRPRTLTLVQAVHRLERDERLTDEEVRLLTRGRLQYLELVKFPEGFHAARVIDAETGKLVEGKASGDGNKYAGLMSCCCGAIKDKARTTDAVQDNPVLLADPEGLALYDVSSTFKRGLETQVRPIPQVKLGEDPFSGLHWGGVTHNSMTINPSRREFQISRSGNLADNDRVRMSLSIESGRRGAPGTRASLAFGDNNVLGSGMGIKLNEAGKVIGVWTTYQHSILDVLGVEVEPEDLDQYNQASVEDSFRQLAIADGVAKAIGLERWKALDLARTASNVYVTMARPDIDPSAILTFQS